MFRGLATEAIYCVGKSSEHSDVYFGYLSHIYFSGRRLYYVMDVYFLLNNVLRILSGGSS